MYACPDGYNSSRRGNRPLKTVHRLPRDRVASNSVKYDEVGGAQSPFRQPEDFCSRRRPPRRCARTAGPIGARLRSLHRSRMRAWPVGLSARGAMRRSPGARRAAGRAARVPPARPGWLRQPVRPRPRRWGSRGRSSGLVRLQDTQDVAAQDLLDVRKRQPARSRLRDPRRG